ncbi:hypothetical protein, partial [Candidatus Ichthyocystis hellenicum]|uniref:hypothetical protein n=1 Tax=Candidatus Ichthyocystis hellenicum TaxID=1561003 RepID=UPI0011118905
MNSIYANGKQYYINQDNCDLCCDEDGKVIYYNCKNDDDIDCTVAPVQRNSALVLPVPVSLTNSSVCSRLNKFIVGAWGLNLHPDDDKLVLFTRRRFSIKIKNNFSRIFSNMLKDRFVLSNGEVLRNCSWPLVSNELVPVATKSSEPIIEEYRKELDIVLPRVRVIDINEDDNCSVTRKVTDHEKDIIMARAMNFTRRRISYMARMAWKGITKIKGTISNVYNKTYADVNTGDTNDALKVRLRYIDDVSILNVRKKFSSNIKVKIHDKFSEMIENKYKLDDGTVIGRFTWSRVSKELFPIAKEEVKTIIDDEIKELEVIISKSRVVVDSEVVREITNEEKRIVLEKNIGFVCNALRSMCTRVWDDLVDPLRSKIPDARDSVVFADNSVSLIDGFKISLYYEDDRAILKIRRKFFRDIKGYISSKFSEMIDDGYKFDDGSTLGMCPWVKVSKKMIPIIME